MRTATWIVVLVVGLAGGGSVGLADESTSVRLMVGRSAIVNTDWPIARVSLTSADIADALVTLPNQLLIQGKMPGTISMFVWDRAGVMRTYDVTVARDLSRLAQQVRDLFPGETITVEGNGRSIVVAGAVASKYIADKAVEVAAGYVEKKEDVVSLLQVRDAGPAPQVLLRVRFAEVSRSALTELGSSFFTGANGYKNFVGRSSTQQYAAPDFDNDGGKDKLVFSDFLNLFVFDLKNQLGTMIKALQTKGLFQSLAEPNLVAESGKEASFLAGGEFPIPVAQGGAGGLAISVVFKEFGIRLNFTPTVTGTDRVRLKVRPEVSTLDFNNAIVLQGFRIPALSTRRTETEIELQDGQTFAIAGLLNNTATQSMQRIPGIGDIPVLGLLFRSKAAQKHQTELVVMITPQILNRNSSGVTADLPRMVEPYLPPPAPAKSFPPPPPAFTTPRTGGDASSATEPPSPGTTPAPPAIPAAKAAGPRVDAAARTLAAKEQKAVATNLRHVNERTRRSLRDLQEQAEKLAREQARRDAAAADKAAKAAARQAAIDKKRQKAIDEATLRLKAAENAYQSELAKTRR